MSSISGSGGTTSFTYDADGNVTAESGATTRSLTWTPYNMPSTITYAGKQIGFQYDADHNRTLQAAPEGTTYYLPDGELTRSTGQGGVWHTYFEVDGERVLEDAGPKGALVHHYFHNDYQNTIGLITNDSFNGQLSGAIENELSDVFGQPRLAIGGLDTTWGAGDVSRRRWINQEDLADAHLIDLNARVYDPLLGKFLSPDPIIANQDDSQSWNAYAYAHNNPMSKEDPTGRDPDENPACQGDCGRGSPPGKDLGHGVTYDAKNNKLYVPAGAPGGAAKQIASAIQRGGSQGQLAGARAVSGLAEPAHVASALSPGGMGRVLGDFLRLTIGGAFALATAPISGPAEALGVGGESAAAAAPVAAAESGLTTAEQLTAAAGRAVQTVGPGSGPVYGTAVHSVFEAEIRFLRQK